MPASLHFPAIRFDRTPSGVVLANLVSSLCDAKASKKFPEEKINYNPRNPLHNNCNVRLVFEFLEKVEGEAPSAGMATPDAKNSAAGGGRDRALSGSIGNERESLEAAPPSLSLTPSSSMRDGVVSAGAHGGLEVDGWFPLFDTLGGFRGELGLSVKLNFIG